MEYKSALSRGLCGFYEVLCSKRTRSETSIRVPFMKNLITAIGTPREVLPYVA